MDPLRRPSRAAKIALAKQMRRQASSLERLAWSMLRNRGVLNLKFRRQHAIERFIVDFYCSDLGLIVEVDGEIHDYTKEEVALRQAWLEMLGYIVIRFTNAQVDNMLMSVLASIQSAADSIIELRKPQPVTPSLRSGEGAGG